ncbi:hypothetical protein CRM73_01630 [Kocuria sp. CCUG 69068]|nr:hypothetical protein [Kocuria sp. CCUG 69068]
MVIQERSHPLDVFFSDFWLGNITKGRLRSPREIVTQPVDLFFGRIRQISIETEIASHGLQLFLITFE